MSIYPVLGMAKSMQQEIDEILYTDAPQEEGNTSSASPIAKQRPTLVLIHARLPEELVEYVKANFDGHCFQAQLEDALMELRKFKPLGPYAGRERNPKTGRWISAGKK